MTLILFKKDTCTYCRKVMKYMEEAGRTDIVCRDIVQDAEAEKELIAVGGKRQVPCLFIEGEPLYESTDIIEWLKAHPA